MSGPVPVPAAPNQLLSINCAVTTTEPTHPSSTPSPGVILGSTPLSQIGVHSCPVPGDVNTLHGRDKESN